MALELDDRQRAMLHEMGVPVWLPQAAPGTGEPPPQSVTVRGPSAPANLPLAQEQVAIAKVDTPSVLPGLDWPMLAQTVAACKACGLCAGRQHSTLHAPTATAQSDWLLVGDPPNDDEDRLGRPFVEQSGLLLDQMLKAVGASRGGDARRGAYLTNVVKCRPPSGRLPQADELAQCAHFLHHEIALVQPKIILAMGRFAVPRLLTEHPQEAALPLDKQRGRVYRYQGIAVVVTYHPTVLLRASANKAKAWSDLCLAMEVLDAMPARPAGG